MNHQPALKLAANGAAAAKPAAPFKESRNVLNLIDACRNATPENSKVVWQEKKTWAEDESNPGLFNRATEKAVALIEPSLSWKPVISAQNPDVCKAMVTVKTWSDSHSIEMSKDELKRTVERLNDISQSEPHLSAYAVTLAVAAMNLEWMSPSQMTTLAPRHRI